jgi:cyanophycinase
MMNVPKGYLVAIGGAEDKGQKKEEKTEGNELNFIKDGVLKDVMSLMEGKNPIIEVLTSATSSPEESFQNYKKAFAKLGCTKVAHLDVRDRENAGDKKYLERLHKCNGVMITGGD